MNYNLKKVNAFNSVLLENWKKAKYLLCSHFSSHGCLTLPRERVTRNITGEYKVRNIETRKRGEKNQRGYPCSVGEWSWLVINPCSGNSAHMDPTPFLSHTASALALSRFILLVQILCYSSETMLVVDFLSI